ncbi:unnamed protein product, partial [Amoebophrya sp. A25]|eukprot:GSA25T00008095001.1
MTWELRFFSRLPFVLNRTAVFTDEVQRQDVYLKVVPMILETRQMTDGEDGVEETPIVSSLTTSGAALALEESEPNPFTTSSTSWFPHGVKMRGGTSDAIELKQLLEVKKRGARKYKKHRVPTSMSPTATTALNSSSVNSLNSQLSEHAAVGRLFENYTVLESSFVTLKKTIQKQYFELPTSAKKSSSNANPKILIENTVLFHVESETYWYSVSLEGDKAVLLYDAAEMLLEKEVLEKAVASALGQPPERVQRETEDESLEKCPTKIDGEVSAASSCLDETPISSSEISSTRNKDVYVLVVGGYPELIAHIMMNEATIPDAKSVAGKQDSKSHGHQHQ